MQELQNFSQFHMCSMLLKHYMGQEVLLAHKVQLALKVHKALRAQRGHLSVEVVQ